MRQKKLIILFFYMALLAACAGIVWLLGRLNSPVEPGKPSVQESEYPEQTETSVEETLTGETEGEQPTETGSEEGLEVSGRPAGTNKPGGQMEVLDETPPPYEPPRLMLVSDLHYMSASTHDDGKAFWNMVKSDDGKAHQYSEQLLDALAARALEEKPSALVLSGDITLNGEKENHLELAKKLKEIQDGGVPVVVIPGNHDIQNHNAAVYFGEKKEAAEYLTSGDDFYEIYHSFGYDQSPNRDPASLSYVYPVDPWHWLLMLDTCQYEDGNHVNGRLKPETLKWLEVHLQVAQEHGIQVLPIGHHNLLWESRLYTDDCTMENYQEITALFEKYQVPLYVSGHLHVQRVKKHQPEPGEQQEYGISEIVLGAVSLSPNHYGMLSWDDLGGMHFETNQLNLEGWIPEVENYEKWSEEFFKEIIRTQTEKKISLVPDDLKKIMADLYTDVYYDYCAGNRIEKETVIRRRAYALWMRAEPENPCVNQIMQMIKDGGSEAKAWVWEPEYPIVRENFQEEAEETAADEEE